MITKLAIFALSIAFLGAIVLIYKTYQRSQQYELFFSANLLDPYNLSAFPTTPDQLPPEDPDRTRVVFFGDSRAAHWPAPELSPAYEFINRGIEAQSAAQTAGRFTAHVVPLRPDYLVVQVGINDLRLIPFFPGQKEAIIASTKEHIGKIVSQSLDLGTVVLLTTIFPTGQAPLQTRLTGDDGEVAAAIADLNTYIRSLAGENVIVLDAAAILADESGRVRQEYSADFLHINAAGYEALNGALFGILAIPKSGR